MATDTAAIVDELVAIATAAADQPEADRTAAIAEHLPDDGREALAEAVRARFETTQAAGDPNADDIKPVLDALADIYTALVPANTDTDTNTDGDEAAAQSAEADDQPQPPAAEGDTPPEAAQPEATAPAPEAAAATSPPAAPAVPVQSAPSQEVEPAMASADIVSHAKLRSVPLSAWPTDSVTGKRSVAKFRAMAAGDTHDITAGSPFSSLTDIADVTLDKLRGLADGGGGYTRTGIVTWQNTDRPDLYTGMSAVEAAEVIDRATDESRLAYDATTMQFGQGWCRPSDISLDFCPPAGTDGMWDVPSMTISGGGIRYPVDVGFADVYTNTGFCYTEAEEIARTEDKPCYMVPCPDFEEIRLQFCGLCIEAGTLVDLAYPSLISNYVAKAMAAFQHKLNAKALAEAWAAATPNDMTAGPGALPARGLAGLIATVLNEIAKNASHLRYKHRFLQNRILEVVMPYFLIEMIQADATLRGGQNMIDTTFAEINTWFARRRLRPQWVYDFDDAYSDEDSAKWGGAGVPKAWPSTAKILIYPAGTFSLVQRPMIRVSGVRNDPQLLRQNIFLALFTETAFAVISRCPEAIALTLPTCVSGESIQTFINQPAPSPVTDCPLPFAVAA